jgi:hypothetical protein
MNASKKIRVVFLSATTYLAALGCCFAAWVLPIHLAAQDSPAAGAASRRIGAVKAINGTSITLTPDTGAVVTITVQPTTRILRIAPGEKNLKNATQIQLSDIQVGDRILVGGKASDDNSSLAASSIVVMKQSDLEAKHEQERQDWQKRGVDGVASAVDAAAGTITITVRSKDIVIHTSTATVIRRYPPDSVKFDDAKPSTLQEIKSGDQVRARGQRTGDGSELTAEEIVSGSFHNIAGTVDSVDASSSTLTVHDLLSKKSLVVKITADSQMHQMPPEMAQRIATRLKGGAGSGATGAGSTAAGNGQGGNGQNPAPSGASGGAPSGSAAGSPGTNGTGGGRPDFQQMLTRIPATTLADLHKGDAVVIVSTEGTGGGGTVVTLLSGVEPILRAAPSASSYALLTPWSMGAPAGDAGGP